MFISEEGHIARARGLLERQGIAAAGLLPPAIAASWTRCLAAGLDPCKPPPRLVIDEARLREARQRRDLLRRLAQCEMENLYHQIAGSNFMVAFAAADGVLLDAVADPSFSATAAATSIRPGTIWTEMNCGTNALGTVAHTGAPLIVHGAEHYFVQLGSLTCIAAPVFDAQGKLAGVLDASSDCRSRQQHTYALVSMAATQIENGLFRECHRSDVLVVLHNRPEYLHTLSAGLLAVDPGGMLLAANTRARYLLQGLPVQRGHRIEDLFSIRFEQMLQAARDNAPMRLHDHVGSAFAARLENVRVIPSIAVRSQPVAKAPAGFVAEDPAILAGLRTLEQAAARQLPILLTGETGTGKEQFARLAHAVSGRKGAFVAINCAALPEALAEAELFGHAEGAFTGARRGGSPGFVQEADGGTLFLDEIGEMKQPLQAILLRLLDDWSVRPVGGGKRRQVNVQLIAATNIDLVAAVRDGRFRLDLFHRLNTVQITLPPLRMRADFPAIVHRILRDAAPEWHITDDAIAYLRRQPWPGNIRELRACLIRLTLAGTHGRIDLPTVCGGIDAGTTGQPPALQDRSLRALQADQIRTVHAETSGNISETARRLRISRNTVYRALTHAAEPPGQTRSAGRM